jgi:hypothetical protein
VGRAVNQEGAAVELERLSRRGLVFAFLEIKSVLEKHRLPDAKRER